MEIKSVNDKIQYVFNEIIYLCIKKQSNYKLEIDDNGSSNTCNRLAIRCCHKEMIKEFLRRVYPDPKVHNLLKNPNEGFYYLDLGIQPKVRGLRYYTTDEIIRSIYINPISILACYRLADLLMWAPRCLITGNYEPIGIGVESLDNFNIKIIGTYDWAWAKDMPPTDMLKVLEAFSGALKAVLH